MKLSLVAICLVSFLLPSCKSEKSAPREVRVYYSNGTPFCEGHHQVSSKNKDSVRVGIWRFFFPDSVLSAQIDYDDAGEVISQNSYSDSGVLIYSGTKKDNLSIISEFYDNGKLKSETIVETKKEDDNTTEVGHFKEYYQSGRLSEESQYVDGELDGIKKVWDRKGNLVLSVKYSKGMIQQ